jgi:hypothetical protein
MVGAGAARADDRGEQQFVWSEANARLTSAQTEAEFRAAARTYMRLVDAGVRNGPLFFNLGTALLKAGEYDGARAAMLRAERYMGANLRIERNLILALARGRSPDSVDLPWYRPLLFWHYELPAGTRVAIAVLAYMLCWSALILRRCGARETGGQILLLCLVVFGIFGSSGAASWWQEHRDDAAGVVMSARGQVSNVEKATR